jgi:hypothetical protein
MILATKSLETKKKGCPVETISTLKELSLHLFDRGGDWCNFPHVQDGDRKLMSTYRCMFTLSLSRTTCNRLALDYYYLQRQTCPFHLLHPPESPPTSTLVSSESNNGSEMAKSAF